MKGNNPFDYKLTKWERIYLPFYRFWYHKLWYPCRYTFKYFLQRIFRGWSDDEAWDVYSHICRRFADPLKSLQKNHYGYPPCLTYRKWSNILKQIVWSFEEVNKDENGELIGKWEDLRDPKEKEKYLRYQKRLNKGFELFGKYFQNLWD